MSDKGEEIVAIAKEYLSPQERKDLQRDLALGLENIIADEINRLIKKGDPVWLARYRSLFNELQCLKKQRSQNASTTAQDLPDTLPDT